MIHEENGQIIVDELRPMSDVPLPDIGESPVSIEFIAFAMGRKYPIILRTNSEGGYIGTFGMVRKDEFIGWIPLPIYRPKDGA